MILDVFSLNFYDNPEITPLTGTLLRSSKHFTSDVKIFVMPNALFICSSETQLIRTSPLLVTLTPLSNYFTSFETSNGSTSKFLIQFSQITFLIQFYQITFLIQISQITLIIQISEKTFLIKITQSNKKQILIQQRPTFIIHSNFRKLSFCFILSAIVLLHTFSFLSASFF